jgi:hypothetical protein
MFLKKKNIFILIYANLFFCFTIILLFGYLHIKYPLLEWTKLEIGAEGIILFFTAHSVFEIWIVTNYYPDKYFPEKFQGLIYTLAVLSSIAIITVLVIAMFYGSVSIRLTNQAFILSFKLIAINLIMLAILNILLIIASFKLQSFIVKEYSKTIVNFVNRIGTS